MNWKTFTLVSGGMILGSAAYNAVTDGDYEFTGAMILIVFEQMVGVGCAVVFAHLLGLVP